jgi:DNA repair protein RadC
LKASELEKQYNQTVQIKSANNVADEMHDIKNWNKEVFVVFCLDSANQIISREIISIGILNSTIVHPREIFRTAILRNANSIIISHNHPSGNLEPSNEDIKITTQIKKAGEIIGIKLLDHVIISKTGHCSMLETGQIV